ncbi:MAG: response regulator [Nitrospirae bacterium]|nr:response regulator [Nitrospirota bacterium]
MYRKKAYGKDWGLQMAINILLIDDEADYSEMMGFWLMAHGYSVRIAGSGEEGLNAMGENLPDVVFLDMQMPEMDGVTTLRKIRMEFQDIPVIMITAYSTEEKKKEAEQIGVNGFFSKGDDFINAAKMMSDILCKTRG